MTAPRNLDANDVERLYGLDAVRTAFAMRRVPGIDRRRNRRERRA